MFGPWFCKKWFSPNIQWFCVAINGAVESNSRHVPVARAGSRPRVSRILQHEIVGWNNYQHWAQTFKSQYSTKDHFSQEFALASGIEERTRLRLWLLLVCSTPEYQATDPRDYLYSKLGLTCLVGVIANYSKSIEEVYCDYGKLWAFAQYRLSFLRHSGFGIYSRARDPYFLFIPSWAPNWDALSKTDGYGYELKIDKTYCANHALPNEM